MPIIKRRNDIQNLDLVPVDIEDTSENSPNFFNVYGLPPEFPAGKTAFLINGSDNLILDSEVRVEILDPDRNVIYTQPIQYLEGVSRLISVYVYPDDAFGEAILTLVGDVFRLSPGVRRNQNIPRQTVRWQKKILINPSLKNTSEIRFFQDPRITVTEVLRPYITKRYGGAISTGSQEFDFTDGTIIGKAQRDEYVLLSRGFDFTGQMVGATVLVDSPNISDPNTTPIPYTTSIIEVKNSDVAVAEDAYQIQTDEEKNLQTIEQKVFKFPPPNTFDFSETEYTMSILAEPTFSETQNVVSFARVRVANMTPFSGDVNLVKLYMKSEGSVGDFELVADQVLESVELLIDSSSIKFNTPTGYFFTQSSIDSFWSASKSTLTIPDANLLYRNNKIIDSMLISGSDERLPLNEYYKVENTLPIEFIQDAEYTFEAKFYAIKKEAQEVLSPERSFEKSNKVFDVNLAKIQVYASGSGIVPRTPGQRVIGEKPEFGKLVTEIELTSNSIPIEKNIGTVTQNFTADKDGDGTLIFIVEAGDWHVSNVSLKLGQETGFSPDLTTFYIRIPDIQKNDPLKFKAEFFDVNNNKSATFVTSSEFVFEGGNSYIGGVNNLITGSLFIGNVTGSGIEMAGVESAFVRTVGYKGYVSASDFDGPGGFMFWSGTVTLNGITNEYQAVGFEVHGGSGSAINPDTGIGETHAMRMRTDTGVLEVTGAIQATFISASAGEIGNWIITTASLKAKSGSMELFGDGQIFANEFVVNEDGDVTASNFLFEGGRITGSNVFIEVPNLEVDATNVEISSVNASMSLGEGSGRIVMQGQSDPYIAISQSTPGFKNEGIFIGFDSTGGKSSGSLSLESSVGTEYLRWDGTNLEISTSVLVLTTSSLQIEIDDLEIDATNFELSTANASMSLGENDGRITLQGQNDPFIAISQSKGTEAFKAKGIYIGFDTNSGKASGTLSLESAAGPEFLRWDGVRLTVSGSGFSIDEAGSVTASAGIIGGFTITDDALVGSAFYMSGSPLVPDGFFISASNFNVRADGDITGSSVFFDGGNIAGWKIEPQVISGSNLLLQPNGTIQTADFISDLKGWRITSQFNGYAEFENAKIRGTLSTTQFVKESVNVVGGQLWVANSTQVSGSDEVGTTDTTWSVDNATAWTSSEIAIVKKFNSTGFSTEYILIESSSLDGDGEATFNGKIYVQRNYGGGLPTGSSQVTGSLSGDTGSTSGATYTPGQTIVSTGLSGSGYIRANANPRDFQTPYIDIVERTGSGVYDLDLKVRIGDLKGISPSLLFGNFNPGFGIYTENGFFTGQITAVTGTFIGIVHAGDMQMGTNVGSIGNGFFLNSNNYWLDSPNFRVGGATNYLSASDTEFLIRTDDFELDATNIEISSNQASMSLGEGLIVLSGSVTPFIAISQSTFGYTQGGIFMGIDPNTESGSLSLESSDGDEYLRWDGKNLYISTSQFVLTTESIDIEIDEIEIDANNFELSSGNASMSLGEEPTRIQLKGQENPYISIQQTVKEYTQSGIFIGSNNGLPQSSFENPSGSEFMRWDGFKLIISASGFSLDEGGNITASNANISGTIQANAGEIGGFTITQDALSSANFLLSGSAVGNEFFISASNFNVKANGDFTASNANISGTIQANAGEIGGFSITQDALSSTNFLLSGSAVGNEFFISASDFNVRANGDLTASSVFLDGGRIAGPNIFIDVENFELDATNIEISSNQASMSLGEGGIVLSGSSKPFIAISQSTFGYAQDGIFLGFDQTTDSASLSLENSDSDEYLRWDGRNLYISTSVLTLTTSSLDINLGVNGSIEVDALNFELSTANASMSLGEGSGRIILQGQSDPYIAISQSSPGFKNEGIFMGFDTTGGKTSGSFSLESSVGTEYLRWDGTNLEISTSVLVLTTSSLQLDINDLEIDALNFELSTANASMLLGESNRITLKGQTNPYISLGQSTVGFNNNGVFIGFDSSTAKMSLKSGGNSLDWDGSALTVSGTIQTTDGNIGLWDIQGDDLKSNSGNMVISGSGGGVIRTGASGSLTQRIEMNGDTNTFYFVSASGKIPIEMGLVDPGSPFTFGPVGGISSSEAMTRTDRTFHYYTDGRFLVRVTNESDGLFFGNTDSAILIQQNKGEGGSGSANTEFIGLEIFSNPFPASKGTIGTYVGVKANADNISSGEAIDFWSRGGNIGLRIESDGTSDWVDIHSRFEDIYLTGSEAYAGKVGIGTNAPRADLHIFREDVVTSISTRMTGIIIQTDDSSFTAGDIYGSFRWVGQSGATDARGSIQAIAQNSTPDVSIIFNLVDGSNEFEGIRFVPDTQTTFVESTSGSFGSSTSVGQIGIGTTAPNDASIHVFSNFTPNADLMHLQTRRSQDGSLVSALFVTSSGAVGIGTSNPVGCSLQVTGSIRTGIGNNSALGTVFYGATNGEGTPTGDGFRLRMSPSGAFNDAFQIVKTDANGADPDGPIIFIMHGNDTNEETVMRLEGDGGIFMPELNTTAGGGQDLRINSTTFELLRDTSSKRYKKNIKNIEIDTSHLYKLRPVSFDSKNDDDNKRHLGLIAEEVYEHIPELVTLDKQGRPDGVSYSYLSVLLLNELKEKKTESDEKDKKIQDLEERLRKLEEIVLG